MTVSSICRTGISEFDNRMERGIPTGSTILVSGWRKEDLSRIGMQFLFKEAQVFDESLVIEEKQGLFQKLKGKKQPIGNTRMLFSTDEPIDKILANIEGLGFYNKRLIDKGVVNIVNLKVISERLKLESGQQSLEEALLDIMADISDELNVRRLVIHSVTDLCRGLQNEGMVKGFVGKLGGILNQLNCTTFLTTEPSTSGSKFSQGDIEKFISEKIKIYDVLKC